MKPASLSVIDTAYNMILDDIEKLNRRPMPKRTSPRSKKDTEEEEPETKPLDDDIEALQLTVVALQERFHERLAEVKRKRNTLSPFHRLPAELIVHVFHLSLSDVTPDNYFVVLAKTSVVSTAWRALVVNTASLWAVISTLHPQKLINTALERSKNAPLTLMVTQPKKSEALRFKAVMGQLQLHMGRVCSFTAETKDLGDIRELTDLPAPALKMLTLGCSQTSEVAKNSPPRELFCGQAEQLQHVKLKALSMSWNSKILRDLKSLHLEWTRPSLYELLDVLAQCPRMVQLTLKYAYLASGIPSDEDILPVVHLPHLKSLWVEYGAATTTFAAIMGRLRVPSCRTFHLQCASGPSPNETVPLDSITHLVHPIIDVLKSSEDIWLRLEFNRFLLNNTDTSTRSWREKIGPASGTISIALPGTLRGEYATWVKDILRPEITQAEINLTLDGVNAGDDIFRFMEGLEIMTVTVKKNYGSLDNLLRHLSRPIISGTTQAWPLPSLRQISIEGDSYFTAKVLLEMIRSRYGLSESQSTEEADVKRLGVDQPDPLEDLYLDGSRCMDRDTFNEIADIVGDEVAEWEEQISEEEQEEQDEYGYYEGWEDEGDMYSDYPW